jgi:hypothetical protein
MFESPAFDPESLLIIYKNHEDKYLLETLKSDQSINTLNIKKYNKADSADAKNREAD